MKHPKNLILRTHFPKSEIDFLDLLKESPDSRSRITWNWTRFKIERRLKQEIVGNYWAWMKKNLQSFYVPGLRDRGYYFTRVSTSTKILVGKKSSTYGEKCKNGAWSAHEQGSSDCKSFEVLSIFESLEATFGFVQVWWIFHFGTIARRLY